MKNSIQYIFNKHHTRDSCFGWLWALKPVIQCCAAKTRKSANSLSMLTLFSRLFFFPIPHSCLLRAHERESARKARAPNFVHYTKQTFKIYSAVISRGFFPKVDFVNNFNMDSIVLFVWPMATSVYVRIYNSCSIRINIMAMKC